MAQPLEKAPEAKPVVTPQPTPQPTPGSDGCPGQEREAACTAGADSAPVISSTQIKVDGQFPVLNPVSQTLEVAPGQVLTFSVVASDTDQGTDGVTQPDTVYYHWWIGARKNDGVLDPNFSWTAPTTPGTVTQVQVWVNDTQWTNNWSYLNAGRNCDKWDDAAFKSQILKVKVATGVPVVWKADTPISGGTLASPQPPATGHLMVAPGAQLTCAIAPAADNDTATQDLNGDGTIGTGESALAADTVSYSWSGTGTFATPNAASSTWTAPTTPGRYHLTCTTNDGAPAVPTVEGQNSTRDDAAITAQVEVDVFDFSVSTNKTTFCAGAIASAPHQATITAVLKDGAGQPVAGQTVAFSFLLSTDTVLTDPGLASQKPIRFKLSAELATTNSEGKAVVTLTSSQLVDSEARVQATCAGFSKATEKVRAVAPSGPTWGPAPSGLMADGESTAPISVSFMHNGVLVAGHAITWRITRVWDYNTTGSLTDANALYIFGSNDKNSTAIRDQYGRVAAANSSEADGACRGIFTVGLKAGTVEYGITDTSIFVIAATSNGRSIQAGARAVHPLFTFASKAPLEPMVYTIQMECDGDSQSGSPGILSGTRENASFTVGIVVKVLKGGYQPTPESQLTLQLSRYKKDGSITQIGTMTVFRQAEPESGAVGSNIWIYRPQGVVWNVSKVKGRIGIRVVGKRGYERRDVTFKIDKRSQIRELALHWSHESLIDCYYKLPIRRNNPEYYFGDCGSFVGYLYGELGLPLNKNNHHGSIFNLATVPSSSVGDFRFFILVARSLTWEFGLVTKLWIIIILTKDTHPQSDQQMKI